MRTAFGASLAFSAPHVSLRVAVWLLRSRIYLPLRTTLGVSRRAAHVVSSIPPSWQMLVELSPESPPLAGANSWRGRRLRVPILLYSGYFNIGARFAARARCGSLLHLGNIKSSLLVGGVNTRGLRQNPRPPEVTSPFKVLALGHHSQAPGWFRPGR